MRVGADRRACDHFQGGRIDYCQRVISFRERQKSSLRRRLSIDFNRGGEEGGDYGTDEKQLANSGSHDFAPMTLSFEGTTRLGNLLRQATRKTTHFLGNE
jgi:hypothetical protein